MQPDEIGYCIWILSNKLWGKIRFENQLRSRIWWKDRLRAAINSPTIQIENNTNPAIYDENGKELPAPIPLEIEFGMPDLNWQTLMKLKPLRIYKMTIGI